MPRQTLSRRCWLLLALLGGSGCSGSETAVFETDLTSAATPWTHDRFDDSPGQFTFAIFSDLTGGEREGVFAVAAAQLALLRPELVVSVGDLIDGPTQDTASLAREWDSFDTRARVIPAPVFYVGGNHDLTGQPLRDVWAGRYGPYYYHFVYKDVLFLILDTEDHTTERMSEILEARTAALQAVDAGIEGAREMEYFQMPERITGNIGAEQSEYFRQVLAENPDVRWTMLFMHKPVWRDQSDPEFIAIEDALGDRPYTIFNGHLHSMSHTVRRGRDYIMLGTTGGSQNPVDDMAFDHVTMVTMTQEGPSIAHLRLDGILGMDGVIPAGGSGLCLQASACQPGG